MRHSSLLIAIIILLNLMTPAHSITAKSDGISVQSLGQAGIKLVIGKNVIYIDAFAEGVNIESYTDATAIIVTHADKDHFSPMKVNKALNETSAVVFADKGSSGQLNKSDRLIELEPADKQPVKMKKGNLTITAFRTEHFAGWNAPNNSYFLEIDNKTIFISGDSYEIEGIEDTAGKADLFIQNTVFRSSESIRSVDSVIQNRLSIMGKGSIFLTHLINCDWNWNLPPFQIMAYIKQKQYDRVLFHNKSGDTTVVK